MAARFSADIIRHLPHLRAFARMLTKDPVLADDLVQETVLKALSHSYQFEHGTNLKAWLTTILRNSYFTAKRGEGRIVQLGVESSGDDAAIESRELTTAHGEQLWHLHMRDFECAFSTLPAVQREAIVLVGASGFSYTEAAEIARCAVGTMKSRVSRARLQLQSLLEGTGDAALIERAALSGRGNIHIRDWEHLMGYQAPLPL
jgi:RNA polymerase sigma-70 factor (ECF subfamily)